MNTEKLSYGMSFSTAGFGALTLNEWAAIGGIVLGISTFLVNLYYKYREDQRAKERHLTLKKTRNR